MIICLSSGSERTSVSWIDTVSIISFRLLLWYVKKRKRKEKENNIRISNHLCWCWDLFTIIIQEATGHYGYDDGLVVSSFVVESRPWWVFVEASLRVSRRLVMVFSRITDSEFSSNCKFHDSRRVMWRIWRKEKRKVRKEKDKGKGIKIKERVRSLIFSVDSTGHLI